MHMNEIHIRTASVHCTTCFSLRQVAAAQAALERGESGAAERLAAAEEELERALEAVLDAECAGGGGYGGKSTKKSTRNKRPPTYSGAFVKRCGVFPFVACAEPVSVSRLFLFRRSCRQA